MLVAPATTLAQSSNIAAVDAAIARLWDQIRELQTRIQAIGRPASAMCVVLSRTLRLGASDKTTNGEVSDLQTFLVSLGYLQHSVTGYYGYLTMQAVQEYQKANGIVISGIPGVNGYGVVGPRTRKAMACGSRSSQTSPPIPSSPSSAGQTVSLLLDFAGQERSYLLHIPIGYDAAKSYPLMISYHGDGGTGEGQRQKTGFDEIADNSGFLVAYPDSNPGYRDGRQWELFGESNDVDFTGALIREISSLYSVDTTRVYVNGFSMGGGMAQAAACSLSTRIAGMANVANNLGPTKAAACHPSLPITTVHFHGTADPVSLYSGGNYKGGDTYSAFETAEFWAEVNGCFATPTNTSFSDVLSDGVSVTDTKQIWNNCTLGSTVVFYTVTGGGHAWPGSSDEAKYGPSSRDLDASQIIWDVLSQSRR